ncbi:hypothetical protein ABEY43_06205 [Priestia megaterium]
MAIGKDKTRTMLTIDKEFKKKLENIAKTQNRSLNNLIITVLKNYEKNYS